MGVNVKAVLGSVAVCGVLLLAGCGGSEGAAPASSGASGAGTMAKGFEVPEDAQEEAEVDAPADGDAPADADADADARADTAFDADPAEAAAAAKAVADTAIAFASEQAQHEVAITNARDAERDSGDAYRAIQVAQQAANQAPSSRTAAALDVARAAHEALKLPLNRALSKWNSRQQALSTAEKALADARKAAVAADVAAADAAARDVAVLTMLQSLAR